MIVRNALKEDKISFCTFVAHNTCLVHNPLTDISLGRYEAALRTKMHLCRLLLQTDSSNFVRRVSYALLLARNRIVPKLFEI